MFNEPTDAALVGLARKALILALFATPSVIFFARHSSPALLVLLAYLLTVPVHFSRRWHDLIRLVADWARQPVMLALLCLLGWMWLSVAWAPDAAAAAIAAGQMTAASCLILLAAAAWRMADTSVLQIALIAGCILCSVILIVDQLTIHTIRYGLIEKGRTIDSNRSAVLLTLVAPGLLYLCLSARKNLYLAGPALVLAIAGVATSYSHSAKLALIAAGLTYGMLALSPLRGWIVATTVMLGFIVATPVIYGAIHDLVPPAVFARFNYGSVEVRALIWEAFARAIAAKPLAGFGLEASAVAFLLPEARMPAGAGAEFLRYGHPHAIPLQVWFELGLGGATLTTIVVGLCLRKASSIPPPQRCAAGAFIAAVFVISAVSHGAWQPWWPSLVLLASFVLRWPQRPTAQHGRPAEFS